MKPVKHDIKHQYQPSSTTCSATALSMMLGHYGRPMSVEQITSKVEHTEGNGDQNAGMINQQLATWCLSLGFKVKLYTFDCQVIDQSWSKLSKAKLLERLKARKSGWVVPSLGKHWTEEYTQSYIDFVQSGGQLHIQPAVTSKLLYDLLNDGPVLTSLSFSTLYGAGRTYIESEDKDYQDDVKGRALNHSIVIYGVDEQGNFLIADPVEKPGRHVIEPERLLAAISTAQIECDNLLFQISRQ